jgi:hypothetical protein
MPDLCSNCPDGGVEAICVVCEAGGNLRLNLLACQGVVCNGGTVRAHGGDSDEIHVIASGLRPFNGLDCSRAQAAGCLKGAAVGGVAGHYAGHHGVLGTGAGCVIGHHEATKHAREKTQQQQQGSSNDSLATPGTDVRITMTRGQIIEPICGSVRHVSRSGVHWCMSRRGGSLRERSRIN